jgi:hypothetical protein
MPALFTPLPDAERARRRGEVGQPDDPAALCPRERLRRAAAYRPPRADAVGETRKPCDALSPACTVPMLHDVVHRRGKARPDAQAARQATTSENEPQRMIISSRKPE